jgi:hypothetical protein
MHQARLCESARVREDVAEGRRAVNRAIRREGEAKCWIKLLDNQLLLEREGTKKGLTHIKG